jgi:hypothetical protein
MTTAQLDLKETLITIATLLLMQKKQPTRYSVAEQLKRELGDTEETAILLDYLEDAWETLDLFKEKVGAEQALAIILCGFSKELCMYRSPHIDEGE